MTDDTSSQQTYRVLARKYRPTDFDEVVGQDTLVRTLTNAIQSGRIAQAFMLSGVRGVGKTTTARIIAKALNCIGTDGQGKETPHPCGVCSNCVAIAQDRHVDVQEMDAASRTGVEDIRELIDSVRYAPIAARYKIYILDEVHMLSRNAFNALLKTLEEPPAHVKFIFATTEIRKVPVTILSRCQRFDLRRVSVNILASYFRKLMEKEGIKIGDDALSLVAMAADGSVRDGLSILDQAITLGNGVVDATRIRDMLGLADRKQVFELFDLLMQGQAQESLDKVRYIYDSGAEPLLILHDLLECCHTLTRLKLIPSLASSSSLPEIERTMGQQMSEKLALSILGRTWQTLMKGNVEVGQAPHPIGALEMVLVRLLHMTQMPTPQELARKLQDGEASIEGGNLAQKKASPLVTKAKGTNALGEKKTPFLKIQEQPHEQNLKTPQDISLPSFQSVIQFLDEKRQAILKTHLVHHTHLVDYEDGKITLNVLEKAPSNLTKLLARFLEEETHKPWVISVSEQAGNLTIKEQRDRQYAKDVAQLEQTPTMKAVKKYFSTAKIERITRKSKNGDVITLKGTNRGL